MLLYIYIAPGQGQTTTWGQNFDDNRKASSLCPFVGNLNQRTSGPVNAHLTPGPGIYFNAFIHVYSPRAWADTLGTNVDVNRKPLSLCPFVASFKTISLKYDFNVDYGMALAIIWFILGRTHVWYIILKRSSFNFPVFINPVNASGFEHLMNKIASEQPNARIVIWLISA